MTCVECGRPVEDDVVFRWHVDDAGVVRLEPVHPVHAATLGEAA